MHKKKFPQLLFFIFFCGMVSVSADEPPQEPSVAPEETEKYFGRAFIQGNAANFAVWYFDLAFIQAPYAHISFESWKKNVREGFEWDNSGFLTNQVLHPYQGSTYYNAARSNGYTFWESIPFTLYGSFVWEFFLERDYPSINDLITTTVGGIAMGEAGYRLSLALIDERATGYKRVLREIAALFANPMLAVNRVVYGDEVLRRNRIPRPDLELILYSGMNRTRDEFTLFGATPHPFLGLELNYGDPYDFREIYNPYDYFSIDWSLDVDVDNPGWDIFAYAILYGRKLYLGEEARGVIGFYQHFDYLENVVYKFAANGAGVGTQLLFPFCDTMSIELHLHLYGIALGGVDSDYSHSRTGRDYSLGPGAGLKTGLEYSLNSLLNFSVFFHQYWFYTLSGSDDQNTVGMFSAAVEGAIKADLKVGLEYHTYTRWSDAGVDDSSTYGLRVYIAYVL